MYYGDGGGIFSMMSHPIISGNSITTNSAQYGGGVYYYDYTSGSTVVSIANNIIAFNTSGVLQSGGKLSIIYSDVYGNYDYDYSGLADPTGANANIKVDPLFVDKANEDYHLTPASPCINAGDSSSDYTCQIDMDGGPRISGPSVDIGADEWGYNISGSINLGTYNGDLSLCPITVRLQQNSADQRVDTVFISDNPGDFNLKNVYPGTYDITFERTSHWLSRTIKGVHVVP